MIKNVEQFKQQIINYTIIAILGAGATGATAGAIYNRVKINRLSNSLEEKISSISQQALKTSLPSSVSAQNENLNDQENAAPTTLNSWITSTSQRLATVEQSIREFTERQSQNTTNNDNNNGGEFKTPSILASIEQLQTDVLQLKEVLQIDQTNNNDSQFTAPSVISGRLATIEQNIREFTEKLSQNTIDDSRSNAIGTAEYLQQIDVINNSIRCLKHEMKKIKTEDDNNKKDLKCVKYEVKKLKDAQAEKKDEIFEIQVDDNQMVQSEQIEELKSKLGKLTQQVQSINQVIEDSKLGSLDMAKHLENTQDIMSQVAGYAQKLEEVAEPLGQSKIDKTFGCIKHELKRLKQKVSTIEGAQSNAQPPTNNEELSQFKAQIDILQGSVDKLTADGKCLKYEVRKLKEQPTFDPTRFEQIQEQLENNASQNTTEIESLKSQLSSMEEAFRCMKHEMKKLKGASKDSADASSSVDTSAFEQKVSELQSQYEKLQSTVDKQTSDTRCLKYEVKQLKERPVVTPPINAEQNAQEIAEQNAQETAGQQTQEPKQENRFANFFKGFSLKKSEEDNQPSSEQSDQTLKQVSALAGITQNLNLELDGVKSEFANKNKTLSQNVSALQKQVEELQAGLEQQVEKLNQQNEQNQNARPELQAQGTQFPDQIQQSNEPSQPPAINTTKGSELNQQTVPEGNQKDSLLSSDQPQSTTQIEQADKASQAPVNEASQQPKPAEEQLTPVENQVSSQPGADETPIQNSEDQSQQEQPLTQEENPIEVDSSKTDSSKPNEQNLGNQTETKEQPKEPEQQNRIESNKSEQGGSENQPENNKEEPVAKQHQQNQTDSSETKQEETENRTKNDDQKLETEQNQQNDDQKQKNSQNLENEG